MRCIAMQRDAMQRDVIQYNTKQYNTIHTYFVKYLGAKLILPKQQWIFRTKEHYHHRMTAMLSGID